MRIIKKIVNAMQNNICQAKQHIKCAYKMKDNNPELAAWFKDMAEQHLKFNVVGHQLGEKAIEAFKATDSESELIPGMVAVYNDKHADLIEQTAQIQYLIDHYGK